MIYSRSHPKTCSLRHLILEVELADKEKLKELNTEEMLKEDHVEEPFKEDPLDEFHEE